ncbi:tetratricopeptide repeat protein [Streptomyces sp. NBC_00487]|uniref:AfsR/SARP family transcriptional regulator n=1 Tax=unclassified Streptomyces TaxID=2593676 RepID=UPI002E19C2E4|nr:MULTISPECIES: BTAD domain-containing putative transcriptional regulator [unclassified Streptomyces]
MALEPVRFAVLGSVRVERAGAAPAWGRPQERALLGLLLVRAGQPVAVSEIVDVLWGRRPPDSAVNVVRRHVGSLRRMVEPGLPNRAVGRWLIRDAGGYRLLVDADSLDLLRFRALRDEARLVGGDTRESAARVVKLLTEAVGLWRGPVGDGLPAEVRDRAGFGAVDRERPAAVRDAADAALRADCPAAVLPMLQEAAAADPLDEPLLARLVLALAATGREAEALGTYRAARARLADELGIDPGPELRDARQTVLRATGRADATSHKDDPHHAGPHSSGRHDIGHHNTGTHSTGTHNTVTHSAGSRRAAASSEAATTAAVTTAAVTTAAGSPTPHGAAPVPAAVPAQLPHDLPMFTGRSAELEQVLALLADHGGDSHDGDDGNVDVNVDGGGDSNDGDGVRPAGTVVISAIGGMAGIGKTTLAVHWAHRVADRFPDGQLYVNLRGFAPSGAVMGAGEAVRVFLDALGVPPERVPHGVDAQAALYRSLLAGRRYLVLLDNARDTEQVRPLLPGTPGCLTIVTSRNQLSGLVSAHGAHTLALRPLDAGQARTFLERRLGAGRLAGEARAVAEIAALCGGLPLALACVAARAAAHPGFPLSAIAAELRAAHGSLDAFSRTDASANVGAVFSWSLSAVSAEAARLFPLLALHPGPDFSVASTAALAELPVRRARSLLTELADVHLVGEPAPGRYALHDLLRSHAAELLADQVPDAWREEATERLYAYYLHSAHATEPLLAPYADPMPPGPPPAGLRAEPLVGHAQALAWLTAEYPVLLAVVGAAARSGRDRAACLLAWALEPFFDRRGHWHDWATVQRIALDAALRMAEPAWEARGLRALARAESRLGLHGSARPRLDRALELFTGLGDDIGRADTHRSLGWTRDQEGDLPGALHHNRLAMELFRNSGRRAAYASVLNSVGWYHALLGEHREALNHCHQALPLLQELGDRYGQAATWHTIAYAHHHLGRHPNALLGYGHALALYRELGVPYLEACTLVHLGDTHAAMSDHDTAREVRQQALTLLITLGHPDADRVRSLLTASERCG